MDIRHPERDLEDVVEAPAPGAKKPDESHRPENVNAHLLSLQRSYGNAAVAGVVQRKPRDRPASTDAPGYKGKKVAPPKKEPEQEDYSKEAHHPKYADWTDENLSVRAKSELDQNAKNSWYFAAELYEEYWFRHQNRGAAMGPWRAYKKIGDTKREEFWLKVMNGAIKPGQPKQEDMSDKSF
jgi:hypothetical protein